MARKDKTEMKKFYCGCGGDIKIFISASENGKTKSVARCLNCGIEKGKPSNFTGAENGLKCS